MIRGKYAQYCFHCHWNDLERVDQNAKAVGIILNWNDIYQGKVLRATWPSKEIHVLELQRLQNYNGHSRRIALMPGWLNENSFIEGIWDAEGSARINPKKETYKLPQKALTISLANEGLIKDLSEMLVRQGLDPTVSYYDRKSVARMHRIYIKYKDQARFRSIYTLQPYKQEQLDKM